MKHIIFAFLTALFISSPVLADQFTITVPADLTDRQKAEIQAIAAQKAAEGPRPGTTTETVKEWVDIGTAIGSGLASSAKQLGIAANDFAQTPVGQFTVFLIGWHFVGEDFIGILFGFVWLVFTIPAWIWMYRRLRYQTIITHYAKGEGPGGATKVIDRKLNHNATDTECVLYWFTLIGIVVIGVSPIVF